MRKTGVSSTFALLILLLPAVAVAQDGKLYRRVTYTCVPEESSAATSFEIMNFKPSYGAPKVAEMQWRAGWGFRPHFDETAPPGRIRTIWKGEIRGSETGELLGEFEDRVREDRNGSFSFSGPLPELPPGVNGATLNVTPLTNSQVLIDECTVNFGLRAADVSCISGGSTLCLGKGGRFRAELDFEALDGTIQTAMAEQTGRDSGYFWFFNPNQPEMILSVENRCSDPSPAFSVSRERRTPITNRLILIDMETGEMKVYGGVGTNPAPPTLDPEAFLQCP